jgi:hypothetical protein
MTGYELLLTVLFAVGMVVDIQYKSEGWAFIPMFVMSAPWSFIATITIVNTALMAWVARGVFENYLFFVIICGGLNCSLFYLVAKRLGYPKRPNVDYPPLNKVARSSTKPLCLI